jgi:hypothetical protein
VLWQLCLPAAFSASSLCGARQAAGLAATQVAGVQMEPPRREVAMALLADLRLSRRCVFIVIPPAQHAPSTVLMTMITSIFLTKRSYSGT